MPATPSGLTLTLDDLSAVAVADGDLPRAARLRGAARNLTTETGAGLAVYVEDTFETGVRPGVRSHMSSDDLARYGAEGAAWTLDQAVAYALDGIGPDRRRRPRPRGVGWPGDHRDPAADRPRVRDPGTAGEAWAALTEPDLVAEWFTDASPLGRVGRPVPPRLRRRQRGRGRHPRARARPRVRPHVGLGRRGPAAGDARHLDRRAAARWRRAGHPRPRRLGRGRRRRDRSGTTTRRYWSGYLDDLAALLAEDD